MQRGAASSPLKKPLEQNAKHPPSKRRKTEGAIRNSADDADLRTMHAALAVEEAQHQQVLDRQAAEAGDTKWSIDFPDPAHGQKTVGLTVVNASYSAIDAAVLRASGQAEEDSVELPRNSGRRSFGDFGKITEVRLTLGCYKWVEQQEEINAILPLPTKQSFSYCVDADVPQPPPDSRSEGQPAHGSEDSDSESGIDPNEEDDSEAESASRDRRATSGAGKRTRDDRHSRKREKAAEARQHAEKRRKKDVKLNQLSSISSGGGSKSKGLPSASNMVCFRCGDKGHSRKDCPTASDGGRGRKSL